MLCWVKNYKWLECTSRDAVSEDWKPFTCVNAALSLGLTSLLRTLHWEPCTDVSRKFNGRTYEKGTPDLAPHLTLWLVLFPQIVILKNSKLVETLKMVQRTQGCPSPMFVGSLTLWHAKVNCPTVLALLAGHVTSTADPDPSVSNFLCRVTCSYHENSSFTSVKFYLVYTLYFCITSCLSIYPPKYYFLKKKPQIQSRVSHNN